MLLRCTKSATMNYREFKHIMSYGGYTGRCTGRLLHFLHEYDAQNADRVIFDAHNQISLYGKPYATYTWDEGTDIPTFYFLGSNGSHLNYVQDRAKPDLIRRDIIRRRVLEEFERAKLSKR